VIERKSCLHEHTSDARRDAHLRQPIRPRVCARARAADSRPRNLALAFSLLLIASAILLTVLLAPLAAAQELPPAYDLPGGITSTNLVVTVRAELAATKSTWKDGAGPPQLSTLNDRWQVDQVRPAYPYEFAYPGVAAAVGLDRMYVLAVPTGTDTASMARSYGKLPQVLESASTVGVGGTAAYLPDDPIFHRQWNLHNTGQAGLPNADINGPEAWELDTGEDTEVTIAIIDSGVDPHSEYADRLLPGINVKNPEAPDDTSDGCPHGTHVAGIAAARGDNGKGVAGVCWGARILPVRVLSGCTGTTLDCARGIIWAVDNGADICSLSLQYYDDDPMLRAAVEYADALGVLVVAAAGNLHFDEVAYPAKYEQCIAVGATNNLDGHHPYSNYGPAVELSAPGADIYSTWIDDDYRASTGTSMATPHVSGLAALLLAHRPELSHHEVRYLMAAASRDLGNAGRDAWFGFGRLDAYETLVAEVPWFDITDSSPPDGAIDARQPMAPDGSEPAGWQEIELTFDKPATFLVAAYFSLDERGSDGVAPKVVSLEHLDEYTVRLHLDQPLEPGTWTTVRCSLGEATIELGCLPGDVDGDGTSTPFDVLHLVDALNTGEELPAYRGDINRSGSTNSADIHRLLDILHGADGYAPGWNEQSLP
jgi:subtilisin family serine protease